MSRIGNKPIAIPAGVTVQVDGSTVTVKGAKGELTRTVHSNMAVEVEGATVHVKRPDDISFATNHRCTSGGCGFGIERKFISRHNRQSACKP